MTLNADNKTHDAIAATDLEARLKWKILIVISVVQLILLLDATIVNVALPQIRADLALSDASLTWVVNAYYIVAGALLLFGGKLGDAFGLRKVFMIGVGMFGAFSLLATLAPSAEWLILGRAGQGMGEALAAATGLAIVSLLFPSGEERTKAFGIWAALGGIGSIVGVILSGAITEVLNWRWVFGINVPLIAILMSIAAVVVPSFPKTELVRLDLRNALMLVVSVLFLVQGFIGTGIESELNLRIGLGFAGVFLAALVLRRCRKIEDGIVPARLMRPSPRFAGYFIVLLQAATSGALFYLGVLHLRGGLGLSQMLTGLAWLPFCFGFFPGIFLAQIVSKAHSPKRAATVGLVISAFGFSYFAWGVTLNSYWLGMFPAMLITSTGFGCTMPVAQSLATVDLSEGDAGAGSGLTTTIQQLGQVAGITLFVAAALGADEQKGATVGTSGFAFAFGIAAAVMLIGSVVVGKGRAADIVSAEDLAG